MIKVLREKENYMEKFYSLESLKNNPFIGVVSKDDNMKRIYLRSHHVCFVVNSTGVHVLNESLSDVYYFVDYELYVFDSEKELKEWFAKEE